MKIKKIEVTNFKAVESQNIDLNGCSVIVSAGNNMGKTSLLRGLIDRLRGEKPEIILKEGEENGNSTIELTDGSIIEWKFTGKTESFSYTTSDGIKMKTGVLSAIGERYFGIKFDIDKFLNSSAKVQSAQLAKLVGLDFTEIDERYKLAYQDRTVRNTIFKEVSAAKKEEPISIEKPNFDELHKQKDSIKKENEQIEAKYDVANEKQKKEAREFNHSQSLIATALIQPTSDYSELIEHKNNSVFSEFIDWDKVELKMNSYERPKPHKEIADLTRPILNSTESIDNQIAELNEKQRLFDNYERDLKEYKKWIEDGTKARSNANEADKKVKAIEAEKLQLISVAKIPEEFKFTEDGVLYNGFPLSNNQLSSSAKYIAALKLGAMALGKVKTMHFDASFLDNKNLAEIENWANENDLQLLIERPDFDGGQIKYEII